MMEHEHVFTGKDIHEATQNGLRALHLTPEAVHVHVLDEGRRGLFGALGARPAKVKLTVHGPYILLRFIETWTRLTHLSLQLHAEVRDKRLEVRIEGDDAPYFVGKHGHTIRALRHLFLTVARQRALHVELDLDVAGYVKRRRGMLMRMAQEKAEKVRQTGRSVRLMPMHADERRMIHMALQHDPDVETYSVGVEPARYVVIRKRQNRLSSDRKR